MVLGSDRSLSRTWLASAAALASGGLLASYGWSNLPITQGLTAAAVGATALLVHARRSGAQLLCRGLWLSAALLATMTLGLSQGSPVWALLGIAAPATALLAMGRTGLDPDGGFRPAAHRWRLLAALGLTAGASASLAFFGLALAEVFGLSVLGPLPLAVALAGGAYAMFRMRTWGLLLLAGSHAVLLGLALIGLLLPFLPGVVDGFFAATSAAALVAVAPLLAAAARRLTAEAPTAEARTAPPSTTLRVTAPTPSGAEFAPPEEDAEEVAEAAAAEGRRRATRRRLTPA